MSADNGIYILRCKDTCKVKECKAIESIYTVNDKLDPIRVYYTFKDAETAKDMNEATDISEKLLEALDYCEYGIIVLPTGKQWRYFELKHRQFVQRKRNEKANDHRRNSKQHK